MERDRSGRGLSWECGDPYSGIGCPEPNCTHRPEGWPENATMYAEGRVPSSGCAAAGPMVRPRRTLATWLAHFRCQHHWTWCHPGDGRKPWSVCTFCGWRDDRR